MQDLADIPIPDSLKDPVEETELVHREFEHDAFWKKIPAFRNVSREEFMDYKFQNRNSVTKIKDLQEMLRDLARPEFISDIGEGMASAPMNMRLSPYVVSLIDWKNPYTDPLRRQFVPVASSRLKDHPKLSLDSLHEQDDSPTPGLVHRYVDKALFLPLDVCPVYCRFCTRSYAIGTDTDSVEKVNYKSNPEYWNKAFAYLASRPEVEDVVVSGGDTYMLSAQRLEDIGDTLLSIPHIRRIRFATKGPAIMPMKILTDHEWTDALITTVSKGRKMGKEVVVHTHFNTVNEITDISREAMNYLFKRGVRVRNQSVLIRGVNDSAEEMINLVKQLSYMNVQPYYVYQHDMVQGVEELRTRIADTVEIERHVRGATAGFNTPTFVTDVPGGGGKRDVHSYDFYDEVTGISVYRSPSVDEEKVYLYFDPIDLLPANGQARWADPKEHDIMVNEAIVAAGLTDLQLAVD
ncbi:MAG: lysine 2,3-aminomutase [Candidatus Marinimicrobia bacterium CG1_02_48_14]|nr:MAG: lysine 2,3-aminomutase [Candidatus Marinimicrobia bacterium CG1_02_48_14]